MSTQTVPQPEQAPSGMRLLLTLIVAVVVAAGILVTTILPAEYGIDPLGTGRALGLTAISEPPAAPEAARPLLSFAPIQEGPVARYQLRYKMDSIELVLGPYDWIEYKYRLEKGASMLYAWSAKSPAIYDFHADPDDAPDAVSFGKGTEARANGAFTAPFAGIHGWYWENPGGENLTVTLTSAGFYSAATEFRSNRTRRNHDLTSLEQLSLPRRIE